MTVNVLLPGEAQMCDTSGVPRPSGTSSPEAYARPRDVPELPPEPSPQLHSQVGVPSSTTIVSPGTSGSASLADGGAPGSEPRRQRAG